MVIRSKKQKKCLTEELDVGDCWIGLRLAKNSGLILSGRVGKHTDTFIEELVVGTEGKTHNKLWYTDAWGGYERVLPSEVLQIVGKDKIPNDWNAPIASSDSRQDDAIVVKTSSVSPGNKRL